jgi:aminoglycoside 3-N-acetyltransferase
LADVRAEYPGKHNCIEHSAVIENGMRVWREYETLFVDGEDFDAIGEAFEMEHAIKKVIIGNATVRFMRQREIVDYAIKWIEKNRGGFYAKRKTLCPRTVIYRAILVYWTAGRTCDETGYACI